MGEAEIENDLLSSESLRLGLIGRNKRHWGLRIDADIQNDLVSWEGEPSLGERVRNEEEEEEEEEAKGGTDKKRT